MPRALAIHVRLHDGRYHGEGDWPPCPARLFQALVAGAGLSGRIDEVADALRWLERQPPPLVGLPMARRGQRVMFYMPNNDMDAVGGDPRRVARIRTAKKFFRPWLFDAEIPFLYLWQDLPDEEAEHASAIRSLADRIYQLGRGIDMAWAWAEVLEVHEVDTLLASYPGSVQRPALGVGGNGGGMLLCPHPGSLESICTRHRAYRRRFDVERRGKTSKSAFRQAPRSSFRLVAYDSTPSRFLFDLRAPSGESSFAPWPLSGASRLVVCLRDGAVQRLKSALPDRSGEVERVVVGRRSDGTHLGPTAERVRIVPLPSIGHPHADRAIRRVFVEVPAACPFRAEDVAWAFSGLEPLDTLTGEVYPIVLTRAPADESMLRHYGIGDGTGSRTWQTITPAALPEAVGRRRMEPTRKLAEAKAGAERVQEERSAAAAVVQALRHADVRDRVEAVRVQREPFEGHGERVETFAQGTRFPHTRLWHVEISFGGPVQGPLVIGDGRFVGLGVMEPLPRVEGIHAFVVEGGLSATPEPAGLARALRRAVLARVQQHLGAGKQLARFFTGHEPNGSPARADHAHLTFVFDPVELRLLVLSPHVVGRRAPSADERMHLQDLDAALVGFRELRAGSVGRLTLYVASIDDQRDPLFTASRSWESLTPYQVTRHTKKVGSSGAFAADVRAECRRRGLPEPRVTPLDVRGLPGVGLLGRARLTFEVAVRGPLVLGRSRHLGGGLFAGDAPSTRGAWSVAEARPL